jgi:exonuclease III
MSTVKILSWNLEKKSSRELKTALSEVVDDHDVDVLVLQESGNDVINELTSDFTEVKTNNRRSEEKCTLRILYRKNHFELPFKPYKGELNKLFFVHLKHTATNTGFNLAGVHLHSKTGNAENKDTVRMHKNKAIATEIRRLERNEDFADSDNTVLAGDFNLNPYDNDLLDFEIFPAVQHRKLISHLTSEASIFPDKFKNLDYWYNPMWNFMGDNLKYDKACFTSEYGSYFLLNDNWTRMWHMIDGFVLRPSIMNCIEFAQSGILCGTSSRSFIKPNIVKKKYNIIDELLSDHLPVLLSLQLK